MVSGQIRESHRISTDDLGYCNFHILAGLYLRSFLPFCSYWLESLIPLVQFWSWACENYVNFFIDDPVYILNLNFFYG